MPVLPEKFTLMLEVATSIIRSTSGAAVVMEIATDG